MRQLEEYDYLGIPALREGYWWEPLKHWSLGDEPGDPFISLGGELRLKYEWIENSDFGAGAQDNGGYLLTRVLPYASLTIPVEENGPEFQLFGQAILAANDGDARGPGPIDEEQIDFLQAFLAYDVPWTGGGLRLQVGRQIVAFGTGRLVDTRYGPNVPLSFDGGIAAWERSRWKAEAFYLRPVRIDPEPLDNQSSEDQQFWGVYATRQLEEDLAALDKVAIDLYYLGFYDRMASYSIGSGRELRHSFGTRFFGQQPIGPGTLDWNYELVGQFGQFDHLGQDENILAWTLGTETGYSVDLGLPSRFFLRANFISGDTDPNDDTLGTFNPLFPKGKYFGELTPVGPYNLINLLAGAAVEFSDSVSLSFQGGPYWRYSTSDAVYGVGGNIVRDDMPGAEARFIGGQAEWILEWKIRREVGVLFTYSQFVPGEFIRQTGPAETTQLATVEVTFVF